MKTTQSIGSFASWFEGFAGIPRGGFFGRPAWVDATKAPGHTSQTKELGLAKTMHSFMTGSFFFFSPNLVWCFISVALYLCFPYDIDEAAKGWSLGWVVKRIAIISGLAGAYYTFFFATLYGQGCAKRKFRPGTSPSASNMAHNLWYWCLGVLQWSLSECAMVRLWATGAVPYVPDREILQSPLQLVVLLALVLAMPIWREVHFYFAHRFIHIRAVYKYVHSVHHRNTDPEPFSGLCMHPFEHLLYFSNALLPTLLLPVSPFVYTWLFTHLGLAPAAGHSGFEDHWQADQYHYIHHAKFECNYGSPQSAWIDQFFGTFREKLGSSGDYRGEYKEDYVSKAADSNKVWSSQSHIGLQRGDQLYFTSYCCVAALLVFWAAAVNAPSVAPITHIGLLPIGTAVGAIVSYGPVVVALLLCAVYDKMSWRWPFHKEKLLGAFGFFAFAGWAACLLPVYKFVSLLCTP